ncbi:glycosyl transferase [Thauera sp. 63]|nr:glycosyl transferase [Thauera sp. 63]
MRNMLAYCFAVLRRDTLSKLLSPDVIVGSSVHPFAALAAAVLAARYQVPFVFEVRDLWPQTLIDMGRLKAKGFVARGMHLLERWLYHRASRIIVLLPHANEYIEPLGVPPEKIVWIPNGVDLSVFPRPPIASEEGSFTLMYLGAHGQANSLETLLKAMSLVRQHRLPRAVKLRMVGDGASKPELMRLATELGISDVVSFEDAVAKREIPRVAAEADAFVICLRDLPKLYRYGISMNKLFDYLAGARPILIASAASNNPVVEAGAGLTVRPDDPEALAAGIVELVNTPSEVRCRMSVAGRNYVEAHHGFDRLGACLAEVLNGVVEERHGRS